MKLRTSIYELDGNKGPYTQIMILMYRCHFGVLVPEGDIGIEVDGIQKSWNEGESLIFDSMRPHRVGTTQGKLSIS